MGQVLLALGSFLRLLLKYSDNSITLLGLTGLLEGSGEAGATSLAIVDAGAPFDMHRFFR